MANAHTCLQIPSLLNPNSVQTFQNKPGRSDCAKIERIGIFALKRNNTCMSFSGCYLSIFYEFLG